MKQIHHRPIRDFREIHWSKSNQLTGRVYSNTCAPPRQQMGSAVRAGPRPEQPARFGLSSRLGRTVEAPGGDVLTCPSLPKAGKTPGQELEGSDQPWGEERVLPSLLWRTRSGPESPPAPWLLF